MRVASLALITAIGSLSTAALAHHSAAQFDFAQTVRIEGVVKEMRVANPHIALFLEVTDAKGKRVIEYEGHSRNNVYRRGWRADMVDTGDTVSIDLAPLRTGEDGGYVKTFILKDGTVFFGHRVSRAVRANVRECSEKKESPTWRPSSTGGFKTSNRGGNPQSGRKYRPGCL